MPRIAKKTPKILKKNVENHREWLGHEGQRAPNQKSGSGGPLDFQFIDKINTLCNNPRHLTCSAMTFCSNFTMYEVKGSYFGSDSTCRQRKLAFMSLSDPMHLIFFISNSIESSSSFTHTADTYVCRQSFPIACTHRSPPHKYVRRTQFNYCCLFH